MTKIKLREVIMQHAKSLLCVLLCIFWISTANGQSFWEYSAQGSYSDRQGNVSSISGALILDGTVRAWHEPNLPSIFPSNQQHTFLISNVDFNVEGLSFSGGGSGNANSLYLAIYDAPAGFSYFSEWFFDGDGDFDRWFGDSQFFNSDGTGASVLDIFEAPPALVHTTGGWAICSDGSLCGGIQMDLTRVSQVAPIPEPEIYAMLSMGLGLVAWVARRKRAHHGMRR